MIGLQGLLLGISLLLASPFPSSMGDPLPQQLGSLRLEESQSGDEARQEIYRLHGKHISFRRGYIGIYRGGEGRAKLWVSEYDSEEEAARAIGKMARGVKTSKEGGFWHFRKIFIEGMPVYFVVGMGQAHYFFQKGVKLIWLAVDPSLAKVAIRDVMSKIR